MKIKEYPIEIKEQDGNRPGQYFESEYLIIDLETILIKSGFRLIVLNNLSNTLREKENCLLELRFIFENSEFKNLINIRRVGRVLKQEIEREKMVSKIE